MRTKKTAGTKTELYYYTGNDLTYITDGANKLKYYFVRDLNGILLQMIDYTGTTPKSYIYVLDAHGSVIGLADDSESAGSTGVVVNYEYDTWGNLLNTPQTVLTGNGESLADANPFRYCGYQFDKETGFYYLKYRYYIPSLGRFLTRDPMMTGNRYVYCRNNPVNFVDPLGLISRPNRSARPRPRSNRPVIYYHAGAAISDYKRRNQSSYINELNNAIVAPDTPISIYAQVFEQRAAQVYTSAISNSSSRVEAYRKMLSIANEADELRSIAKYIGNAGKIVGGFGTVITGVVNIHGSINNPLYNLEDMRKAIAIDVIATGISVAAIVLLPATTPLLVGLAIGAGISYGASALKEGLID